MIRMAREPRSAARCARTVRAQALCKISAQVLCTRGLYVKFLRVLDWKEKLDGEPSEIDGESFVVANAARCARTVRAKALCKISAQVLCARRLYVNFLRVPYWKDKSTDPKARCVRS